MTLYRIFAAALGLMLAGAIAWASVMGAFFEEGGAMFAMPWGVVTFIDLYTGFFLAASLILAAEPNKPVAISLAVLVLVLGGVVTAAWAVWRAPLLWSRLRQPKA
jgi:hypothetical protein